MKLQDLLSHYSVLQIVSGLNNIHKAAKMEQRSEDQQKRESEEPKTKDEPQLKLPRFPSILKSTKVQGSIGTIYNNIPTVLRYMKQHGFENDPIYKELEKYHKDMKMVPSKDEILAYFEENSLIASLASLCKNYRESSSYVANLMDAVAREKRIKDCDDPYLKVCLERHHKRHSRADCYNPKAKLKEELVNNEELSRRMISKLLELDDVYNTAN